MDKKIYIYANDTEVSKTIEKTLRSKLVKSGLRPYNTYSDDTELIICIGGDGTLLRLVQEFEFRKFCRRRSTISSSFTIRANTASRGSAASTSP